MTTVTVSERTASSGPAEPDPARSSVEPTPSTDTDLRRVHDLAALVADPEIPVLTIADLGVLRGVRRDEDGTFVVTITPTYSGCPAMDTIRDDVLTSVRDGGFARVRVELVLAPAWTTAWMSEDGRRKLTEYGIAPPHVRVAGGPVPLTLKVACPQCGSLSTREQSRFGSTACKSLWRCSTCQEPFDHFKTI